MYGYIEIHMHIEVRNNLLMMEEWVGHLMYPPSSIKDTSRLLNKINGHMHIPQGVCVMQEVCGRGFYVNTPRYEIP